MGKYSETRYANMIPTFEPAPLPASEAATAQKSNMRVYETFAALPATSTSKGNTAFVKATNKLYVWNGVGWYIVAEVTNASPSSITGVNASYDLASDGTATTITAVATDPEGFALTWSSSVTAGSLNGTTVSNVDNVFTVTPHATNATTFTLTFSVTDGVNSAVSAVSGFTLSFGFQGTASAWIYNSDASSSWNHQWGQGSDNGNRGTGVAINETQVAVSASDYVNSGSSGVGVVYIHNATSGNLEHTITENSGQAANDGDRFGRAVALDQSGAYLVVGQSYYDNSSSVNQVGRVQVFNPANGSYRYSIENTIDNYAQARFGQRVVCTSGGTSNDTIYIGIPNALVSGNYYNGRVAAYNITNGSYRYWNTGGATLQGNQYLGGWGLSCGTAYDDPVCIGSSDYAGSGHTGRVYICSNTLSVTHTLTNPQGTTNSKFGISIDQNSTHVIVGCYASNENQCKVYIYQLSSGNLTQTINCPNNNGYFGMSVSINETHAMIGQFARAGGGSWHLYKLSDMSHTEYRNDINGNGTSYLMGNNGAYLGSATALNDTIGVVSGTRGDNASGQDHGAIRVYV